MGSCDQVSLPSKAMESFKVSVCMCLLVGLAQSAPQNTNEVVRTVTTQLQPLISDAVARALAGLNTVSASSSRFATWPMRRPGMELMSRENTTMLTALELLSLSPTRLDLRDTQRPEMSRRELLR